MVRIQRTAAEFSFIPLADRESVFSFRGQVLPAASLLNIVDVELIYDGVKYILKVKAPGFSDVSNTLEAGGSFYFCSEPCPEWTCSCLGPGTPQAVL